MNPEFLRNLWLEATPRRLGLISGLLLLAFFAAASSPLDAMQPHAAARLLFYFFVIGWGTRNAALAVVGEIRDRTWDAQRLSAIEPFAMTWAKLFGATAANWFGGLVCLGVFAATGLAAGDGAATLADCAALVLTGVLSQAVSLLASLMLVRRRQAQSRLDTFLCQTAGIAAALPAYFAAKTASDGRALSWWGHLLPAADFYLLSLLLFTAWALVGCYRMMRLELRMTNGPFVWLGWLVFGCLYAAGFDIWNLAHHPVLDTTPVSGTATRLGVADLTLVAGAYAMVFLERKDTVRLRWLGEQLQAGRLWTAFQALDAWMMSYAATVIVTLVLALVAAHDAANLAAAPGGPASPEAAQSLIPALTALGFVTRDMALCLVMSGLSRQKRGEFGFVAVLFGLYVLLPAIFRHAAPDLLILFLPKLAGASPAGILVAWAEAAAMGLFVWRGLRRPVNAG